MQRLHIFRSGRHIDSHGRTIELSLADVDAAARAYSPETREARFVIGHPASDLPAHGYVESLSADNGDLYARPREFDPDLEQRVRDGRYKKISASFFLPDDPDNPVPGVYYLKHVGFLGAQPPAIKGLRTPEFAEESGAVSFAAPRGYSIDPDGLELHHRAVDYMREHPEAGYVAAVMAVDH